MNSGPVYRRFHAHVHGTETRDESRSSEALDTENLNCEDDSGLSFMSLPGLSTALPLPMDLALSGNLRDGERVQRRQRVKGVMTVIDPFRIIRPLTRTVPSPVGSVPL